LALANGEVETISTSADKQSTTRMSRINISSS
jgi:hypothetical protein